MSTWRRCSTRRLGKVRVWRNEGERTKRWLDDDDEIDKQTNKKKLSSRPLTREKKLSKNFAAKSEGHFAILIFSRLDALLRDTRPRRSVVLALDGPAPLAKLLTQRLRRKRAGRKATRAEEAEAEEFLSAAANDDDAPPSPSGSLNSLHLTPGSPLMRFVADALEYFICARLEGSAALKRVQWELSGADVPGEGELKLLSRLRSHWWGPADGEGVGGEGRAASTGSSSSSDEDDEGEGEGGGGPPRPGSRRRFLGARRGESHCVVGGDSDLLLMASLADARGPVFVMADSKPAAGLPQGGGGASSSGRGGGSRGGGRGGGRGRGGERTWRRVFSVDALDAAIARDLGLGPGPLASAPDGLSAPSSPPRLQRQQQRQQQQQQLRRRQQLLAARTDLVLLSIVSSGNDYLPPVHGIDLKASWAAYRAVVRGRWSGGGGGGGDGGSGGGEEGPSAASPSPPPLPLPPRVSAIVVPPPSGPGGGSASIDPELLAVVLRAGATARGWRPRRGGNKKKGSPGGGGGGGGDGDEESPPSLSDDDDNAGDLDGDFRPACDPAAYLRGAAWVLGMYCTGVCADWRFCYDARGPGVEELLAELEAEAARKKKERESFAAGLPPSPPPPLSYSLSRKSPPLAPAVCAAALLPPGPAGAAAAPAPLRGLWDVSSSPAAAASAATAATKGGDDEKEKVKARDQALVELFTVCDACESLSERSGAAQGALLAALGAKKRLEQEEADAKAAPSPQSSSPETTAAAAAAAALAAEAVDLAVSAAKDAVRAVNRARNTHVRAAHPYAPFPLEKLERAVEEALLRGGDGGGKGGHRAALLAFGRPRRYWRCAEAESYYSNNARAAAAARAVVSRSVPVPFRPLPSPPSSRLRILEPCVKRPIVREELPEEVVLSSPSDGNGTGGGSRSRSKSRVLEKAKEEGAGSAAPPPVPAAAAATARTAGAVSSRGRGRTPRAAPRAPKALLVTAATAAAAATAPLPLPPHRRRPLFSACASVRRLPCSSPRLPW